MGKLKTFFKTVTNLIYIFLSRWGFLVVGSIFLTWFLQYRVFGNDAEAAWTFVDEKPRVFWYSALIMFCLTALVYGLVHRPFRTLGIMTGIIIVLTYINLAKVGFRGTPLLPEDFQLADQTGTLTKFLDFWEIVRIIIATTLAVRLGFLIDRLTKRRYSLDRTGWKRWQRITVSLAPRVVILVAAFAGLIISTDFIRHHSGAQRQEIDWLDNTEFVAWNQTENYERNGFLIGFIYNLEKITLQEPNDYSEKTIASVKKKYQSSNEADATALTDADYNIIIVLNESFYDTALIQETYQYTGADTTPVFHEIMESYPSGYMYSPDYGGGTANIEFEVLTGLSNYWAQTVPYTDILPKLETITAVASEVKASGYQTTAIHAFNGGMYKRNIALKTEGFDNFITESEMKYDEHDGNSQYINDRSIYNETLDILRGADKKQFIGVITMQNHAPYDASIYESYDFELSALDFDPIGRDRVLGLLQTVHNSDQYLGEFLSELSKLDEKTVVLFFGDHAGGVFPMVNESLNKDLYNLSHLTPYFIWSNFKTDDQYSDPKYGKQFLADFGNAYGESDVAEEYASYGYSYQRDDNLATLAENITLPTTTPNCLTNALYGVLNLKRNAEKTLLQKVCETEPILTQVYLGETVPSSAVVHDYELLNYDVLGGEQYWLK